MSNNDRFLELQDIDLTPNQRPAGDHYAHASGRICTKCDRLIDALQPARRRGETGWVHDVCPPSAD
jgi:hypothetical protein